MMTLIQAFKLPTAAKIKELAELAMLIAALPTLAGVAMIAMGSQLHTLASGLFVAGIAVLAEALVVALVASLFAD